MAKENKLSAKLKEKLFKQWSKDDCGMTFKEYCEAFGE